MSRRTGKHRIYMNVGYDLSEQQLRDFFNQYGNVTDVYLPKHKSGRNKGFGFTTFDSEDGLRSALAAQEYIIGGDLVKINRAGPRPEHELQREAEEAASDAAESDAASRQPQLFGKGPRLYVGGVPEELTEQRLKAHFSRWGNVVDLYFPGKKGQSRVNYCFVTFGNWRAAQRACNQSERSIDGLPLQSINLAQERSAEQEQQARVEAAALDAKAGPAPSLPVHGDNFGALGSAPDLALARHFHLQAQMQAHQLGAAGLSIQERQQQLLPKSPNLPGMMPALDTSSIVAAMATHPEAYQQLLNSMLGQQGRTASYSSAMLPGVPTTAGMSHAQPSAVFNTYGSAVVNPSAQYPQGLGSMPTDARHWLAAQAALAATIPTRQEHMPDLHMMPQAPAVLCGSQATPPVHHSSLHKVPPDQQPVAFPPGNWEWPTASLAAAHSMGLAPGSHPQAGILAAQPQLFGQASAFQPDNLENQQLPFGVLNLAGFGPLRSTIGRPRKSYTPY
ncbi:TPA: hypothetical protein ACH3X2_010742 [Trebouxia sp. C0005]